MTKQTEILVATATIDEALEKTHFGKFNIKLILFSGLVLNNVILESVGISFALPVVACDLNLSYQEQGVLGAVCFLGIIISSHLWGFLADTKGRKQTMRSTLVLAFFVTFASSFSYNFIMMAVLRFLNGVFHNIVALKLTNSSLLLLKFPPDIKLDLHTKLKQQSCQPILSIKIGVCDDDVNTKTNSNQQKV